MSSKNEASFTFVDLFAGIGGFHAALSALGGKCVYASEIDEAAAKIYQHNWEMDVAGDIVPETEPVVKVPNHDVLAAGFPCQPFSKSGFQRGMDEARGTLFWNILRILAVRQPSIVILENVRNIAGPRHQHEWDFILRSLRDLGYEVSSTPAVFSPHLLAPGLGGRPQVRERVFIVGRLVGAGSARRDIDPVVCNRSVPGWDPQDWDLSDYLDEESSIADRASYCLTPAEESWINTWSEFVRRLRSEGTSGLPGFPIWADAFRHADGVRPVSGEPAWKTTIMRKNAELYTAHQVMIDGWLEDFDYLREFPASRRKLEWQAQDAPSLGDCILQLRPSGIRIKRATYVPALVAMTQTTILGRQRRRLTPREAARLQGLPEDFTFLGQPDKLSYKQVGNGVNVGVAYHIARLQMRRSGDGWAAIAAESRDDQFAFNRMSRTERREQLRALPR